MYGSVFNRVKVLFNEWSLVYQLVYLMTEVMVIAGSMYLTKIGPGCIAENHLLNSETA